MNQIDREQRQFEVDRRYRQLQQLEMKRHIVLIATLVALGGAAVSFLSERDAPRLSLSASREQFYREPAVFWSAYQKEENLVRQIGLQAGAEMRGKPAPVILTYAERSLRRDMRSYIKQGYNEAALLIIIRDVRRFAADYPSATIEHIWGKYRKARITDADCLQKRVSGMSSCGAAVVALARNRNRV